MSIVSCAQVIPQLGAELAGVAAAMADTRVRSAPGEIRPGPGYLLTIVAAEGGRGALAVHLDRAGADTLARRATGSTGELPEAEVLVALSDMCAQAAAGVADRLPLEDVRLTVGSATVSSEGPASGSPALIEITIQGEPSPVFLALWGTLELGDVAEPATAGGPVSASAPGAAGGLGPASPDFDVILDMELPLIVRFGRTEMSLKALTALAPGAVIDLGRSPDDPVEVLVSNQVVARGEVITVSGNYGVRITDIISPAERARYLEVAK